MKKIPYLEVLKQRAKLLERIRAFFKERNFLEIETPLLSKAAHTDVHIEPLTTSVSCRGTSHLCYLQTSPELAMKRLLAAGTPPIFQITKAFRNKDYGRYHHPEFTMLEWYRPGYDHHQLMQEVDAFLQAIFKTESAEKITYRELFLKFLGFDPFTVPPFEKGSSPLVPLLENDRLPLVPPFGKGGLGGILPHISEALLKSDKDTLLQYLFSHHIEPHIAQQRPLFVYDFPASQAALAKVRKKDRIAERFEVYFKGIELGNGFHELTDPIEQRARFEADLQIRQLHNQQTIPIDEAFLESLVQLPPCAGIAMGVDRLVMLATGAQDIAEVMAFKSV